jgi:hypothetical protein
MAANTNPIFPLVPSSKFANLTLENTSKAGLGALGTAIKQVFLANADGGRVDRILAVPLGSAAVNTVLRVFLNNGGDNTVQDNNSLLLEIPIKSETSNSIEKPLTPVESVVNWFIEPNHRILVSLGTAVPEGVQVTVMAGKFS